MQKQILDRFIQKYNLNGNVNAVKWKSNNNTLSTDFVTADKSLLGSLKMTNFNFKNSEIGVYNTDKLKSLLSVLDGDVSMDIQEVGDKSVSLDVANGSTSINYVLSDLSIIRHTPSLKHIPDFDLKLEVDGKFIEKFIKGKSALNDVDTFTIVEKSGSVKCIIGYASTNTNRINLDTKVLGESGLTKELTFNANLFRDVLSSNKECTSAVLEVSNEGLAKVNFKIDDYDSTYYIVAMQDVD